MHTLTRSRAIGAGRGPHQRRVLRPIAGQCFEIVITHDGGRWLIRIPEIDGAAEATHRSAVELAARTCIAARTGIPLGYVSVWVRD